MLKSELVAEVSKKTGISKTRLPQIIHAVLDTIKEKMESGDSITFIGFGTFKIVDRAERKGRNPSTGEEMSVPAKKALVFKPSKVFVKQLNKKAGE